MVASAASRCAEQLRHGESHAVQPWSPGGANDDRRLPPDNNRVERQIRPVALQRANQLFVGSLRAGQRAVSVMSLVRSARPNGHDLYADLRDVLECLSTQLAKHMER
ncbi:TPA: transposase [Pseudomonas aeruginosa]|uniref:Transposase n=5 Tax=Pseudomonadota TaxID=1224 RepID=A0A939GXT5_9BURK|nr:MULTISPECIES: transposase [Pseudomonadota]EFL7022004.1 IS66 family transposase [Escherichia coli]EKT4092451.1 transposase [Stenotrophomonas maltophilia]EKV4375511.1 transposase [Citrobacter freundii]MBJ3796233.1 transposase [Enterobacter asburiae]MBO1250119.1 transposase [Comamonas denitrificans]MBP8278506.1 transposase [Propionivibrio sp.]MBS0511465.1 transposase [Pseudomonadota bacterium]MBU1363110.1 transposase [Gammaproteobacteria bacterium]MCE1118014.1 transposase [Pseudomonas sp. 